MPLAYVLDENLRGLLWRAVLQHNRTSSYRIDTTRVGDPPHLPRGSSDLDILLWAERNGRILVSLDRKTLVVHLAAHLAAGHHSPGEFLIRPGMTLKDVTDFLYIASG